MDAYQCFSEVIGVYARQDMGEDGEEMLLAFWVSEKETNITRVGQGVEKGEGRRD